MNYFDQVFFGKYLREGEELFFVSHRHPLLIIDRILVTLFLGLAIPTFFYYNDSFQLQSLVPFLYFEAYAIFLYLFLVYKIFDWYNDVWIITDLGVIDVDWDVFTRHVIYIDYDDIRGSEVQTHSFLDSLFHKGDVSIYTENEEDNFILEWAENPNNIADHIKDAMHEVEERRKQKEKAPMELLLHTLTEVVRDHLEGNGRRSPEEEREEAEEIQKTLARKGTIDLR